MARISGVDIPRNKRVEVSLTYISGIGIHTIFQMNIGFHIKKVQELAFAIKVCMINNVLLTG